MEPGARTSASAATTPISTTHSVATINRRFAIDRERTAVGTESPARWECRVGSVGRLARPMANDDAFSGRVALVTGASGGIGTAISRALAGAGAKVAVGYSSN